MAESPAELAPRRRNFTTIHHKIREHLSSRRALQPTLDKLSSLANGDDNPLPTHSHRRRSRIHRAIAPVVIAASTVVPAGILSPEVAAATGPQRPTSEELSEDMATTSLVLDDIYYGDLEEIKKHVDDIDKDLPWREDLKTAVRLTTLDEALKDLNVGSIEPQEVRKQLEKIPDSVLKERVARSVDLYLVSEVVSELNISQLEPKDALTKIEDIQDPLIQGQAKKSVDIFIEDQALGKIEFGNDQEGALKLLDLIQDPAAKARIETLITAAIVERNLNPYDEDLQKAQQQALSISDPAIRKVALDAIEDRIKTGYADYGSIPWSRLRDFVDKGELEAWRRKTEESLKYSQYNLEAYDISNELEQESKRVIDDIDAQIAKWVQEYNAIRIDPTKPVEIDRLTNPGESIDLSGVEGSKEIHNLLRKLEPGEDNPKVLAQFAEISASDGTLTLTFEEGSNIGGKAKDQIKEIVADVEPLLLAAFANGDLASVRFIIDEKDHGPYYVGNIREIHMVLPQDDSTSVSQLRATLVHENVHALTRSAFATDAEISPVELQQLSEACTAVRNTAHDATETAFNTFPGLLNRLRDKVKPQHKEIFDRLIDSAKRGTLESDINGDNDYDNEFFNDCLETGLHGTISDMAYKLDPKLGDYELDYLFDLPQYDKLFDRWIDIQDYFSIYERLNESTYVKTDYLYADFLGHSRDEAGELVASVGDIAINYPRQFANVMKDMDPSGRDAAIKALRLSFTLIINRHPSLLGYLAKVEAEILTRANS